MAYFNFALMSKRQLTPFDIICLQLIHQGRTEDLSEIIAENVNGGILTAFEEAGYIDYIKKKKASDTRYNLIRLSKKGKDLLAELEEPPVEEQDTKVAKWLSDHYKSIGKDVGNLKRTTRHIRDFRIKSGVEKNNLINLCLAFLADDENMQFNFCLEYMFYKAKTVYATKFNLEDSRLYKYYLKHKEHFDKNFIDYE